MFFEVRDGPRQGLNECFSSSIYPPVTETGADRVAADRSENFYTVNSTDPLRRVSCHVGENLLGREVVIAWG